MAPFVFSSKTGTTFSTSLSLFAIKSTIIFTNAAAPAPTTNLKKAHYFTEKKTIFKYYQNEYPSSAIPSDVHMLSLSSRVRTLFWSFRKNSASQKPTEPPSNKTALKI